MDECYTGEIFFEGLDPNILGDHWLIIRSDEHFYWTTTPLQLSGTCQRVLANMVSRVGLTTEFKTALALKGTNKLPELRTRRDWYESYRGIHANFAIYEHHNKGVHVLGKKHHVSINVNEARNQADDKCSIHPNDYHANAQCKVQKHGKPKSVNREGGSQGKSNLHMANKPNKWQEREFSHNGEASI